MANGRFFNFNLLNWRKSARQGLCNATLVTFYNCRLQTKIKSLQIVSYY